MKKLLLMSLLGTLFCSYIVAQKGNICGTTQTKEELQRLIETKKFLSTHPVTERAITYVPVKFHIVSNDAGTGSVAESAVLDMLCGLNEFYLPFDIQFYIKDGFNYFNSSVVANDPQSDAGVLQILGKKKKQMVNIFLSQSFPMVELLGYYQSGISNDFLVLKKGVIGAHLYTVEHEMGHYFTLPHPFNGWEDNDYNPAEPPVGHGNPVKILLSPANDQLPIEFVDGSNCNVAGDLICDTPASYNFANSFWLGKGCLPLDNSVKDFHGDVVNPDEKNVMDYFNSCTDYHFSLMQQDIIKANLISRKSTLSNYKLNTTTIPNLNPITANVLSPNIDSGKVIGNFGDIKLDWEDIPGASGYYVEIDGSKNFISPALKTGVVTASEWTAPGLLKNKVYYWHVYPYNEYYTCAGFSKIFGFTTGQWVVSTNDIKELDSWKINPNPAEGNSIVSIEVNTLKEFNAAIVLADITGKTVSTTNMKFSEGEQKVDISTNNLTPGMYVVQLKTETGISTQKLVIH